MKRTVIVRIWSPWNQTGEGKRLYTCIEPVM
jgi:hypothetical protein